MTTPPNVNVNVNDIREALDELTVPIPTHCSQCGLTFGESACGPTHALIWHYTTKVLGAVPQLLALLSAHEQVARDARALLVRLDEGRPNAAYTPWRESLRSSLAELEKIGGSKS